MENQLRRWPGLRFSMRQLLAGMAVIALGCVALRSASPLWTSILMGGMLLLLSAAILGAVYRHGSERAWCVGFALLGWLYVLLLLVGWSFESQRLRDSPLGPDQLITTQVSHACYHRLYDEAFERYFAAQAGSSVMYGGGGMMMAGSEGYTGSSGMPTMATGAGPAPAPPLPYPGPSAQDFANVAHALWTLLLALCGGWFAQRLFDTSRSVGERGA